MPARTQNLKGVKHRAILCVLFNVIMSRISGREFMGSSGRFYTTGVVFHHPDRRADPALIKLTQSSPARKVAYPLLAARFHDTFRSYLFRYAAPASAGFPMGYLDGPITGSGISRELTMNKTRTSSPCSWYVYYRKPHTIDWVRRPYSVFVQCISYD